MQSLPLRGQLPMCAATLLLHHGHPGRDQHKIEHHIKTSFPKEKLKLISEKNKQIMRAVIFTIQTIVISSSP